MYIHNTLYKVIVYSPCKARATLRGGKGGPLINPTPQIVTDVLTLLPNPRVSRDP